MSPAVPTRTRPALSKVPANSARPFRFTVPLSAFLNMPTLPTTAFGSVGPASRSTPKVWTSSVPRFSTLGSAVSDPARRNSPPPATLTRPRLSRPPSPERAPVPTLMIPAVISVPVARTCTTAPKASASNCALLSNAPATTRRLPCSRVKVCADMKLAGDATSMRPLVGSVLSPRSVM